MPHTAFLAYDVSIESGGGKIKKGELPRLECFHNGIILIVICFRFKNRIILINFN